MRAMRSGRLSTIHKWSASVDKIPAVPIIIEGPDGAGKTTLAEQIAEKYERWYRRPPSALLSSTHGPDTHLPDWWDEQLGLAPSKLAEGVYDRCFYISDPIYQQAQAHRELLVDGPHLVRGISRLWSVEPILIFCLPPFNVQLTNVQRADRDRLKDVGDEALLKIYNAYWSTYAWASQALYDNVMTHDYTEEGSWERLTARLQSLT